MVAIKEFIKLTLLITFLLESSALSLPPTQRQCRLHYSTVLCSSPSNDEDATPTDTDDIVEAIEITEPAVRLERQQPPPPSMSANDMMRALGTSPRRIALGVLSASGIALAGNFLGVTSRILTAVPEETVEKTSLDTYFPRVSLPVVDLHVFAVKHSKTHRNTASFFRETLNAVGQKVTLFLSRKNG